jgi:tetratricopeptide (TPR) repeat protein
MTSPQILPPSIRPLPRHLFVRLAQAAVHLGHTRFARQACLAWLAAYPGDLPLTLLYAQVLLQDGHPEHALPVLRRLCQTDPEYTEAVLARLEAEKRLNSRPKSKPRSKAVSRKSANEALSWAKALVGETGIGQDPQNSTQPPESTVVTWSQQVLQARKALEANDGSPQAKTSLELAEVDIHPALASDPDNPLVGTTHLRLLRALDTPSLSIRSLAEYYHQRWPDCLQFQLILAEALMQAGQDDEAVALLHRAAARDLTGQVANRLWGRGHAYRTLWPERLELTLDMAIPASVAATLGWNQLPGGTPATIQPQPSEAAPAPQKVAKGPDNPRPVVAAAPPQTAAQQAPDDTPRPVFTTVPETLRSVQAELERIAERLHQPELARSDGRFPVYVVMTTKRGLETQYGAQAVVIQSELNQLVQAVQARRDWRAMTFYADEGQPPEVRAARPSDPWALKLALADLDAYLGRKGEMIGAVLIVGGPEIVPFHHLPNPVDDADDYVPSDNPYATRDENYFVPEWPVGRLPGCASKDPGALVTLLKSLTERHTALAKAGNSARRSWWISLLLWLLRRDNALPPSKHKRPSFGYSTAAWHKASQMVYRPIGEANSLLLSPPLCANGQGTVPLPSGRLAYFNLHGLEDAVEWYGQSETVSPEEGEPGSEGKSNQDYPIAVRPQDLTNGGHAPQVVFSEACYGAHILGKTIEEALALKFLQVGSQAVVGSTCTAYGSINTPLTAADYLGHAFWNALKQGSSAGEALRRAKVSLAREMHRRQGYLDGEDQKTLISFVLYGDPLSQPLGQIHQAKGAHRPAVIRPLRPPRSVKTICDRARQEDMENPVPQEVVDNVKSIVEQYLPGMQGAQVALVHEHADCSMDGHQCPTGQLHVKPARKNISPNPGASSAQSSPASVSDSDASMSQRRIVILSKEVNSVMHVHHHYARLTLDDRNRLVKLVVSR